MFLFARACKICLFRFSLPSLVNFGIFFITFTSSRFWNSLAWHYISVSTSMTNIVVLNKHHSFWTRYSRNVGLSREQIFILLVNINTDGLFLLSLFFYFSNLSFIFNSTFGDFCWYFSSFRKLLCFSSFLFILSLFLIHALQVINFP